MWCVQLVRTVTGCSGFAISSHPGACAQHLSSGLFYQLTVLAFRDQSSVCTALYVYSLRPHCLGMRTCIAPCTGQRVQSIACSPQDTETHSRWVGRYPEMLCRMSTR